MNKFSRDLVQGMKEAAAFTRESRAAMYAVRVPPPELPTQPMRSVSTSGSEAR